MGPDERPEVATTRTTDADRPRVIGLLLELQDVEVRDENYVADLDYAIDAVRRFPVATKGRLRVGRRVGRTIYRQLAPEPSDQDPLIGVMDTPELAAEVVVRSTAVHVIRERLEAVIALEVPPAGPEPWVYGEKSPYFYHPREWSEGYVQAAKDFLKVIADVR